jgi:hypothetical protein
MELSGIVPRLKKSRKIRRLACGALVFFFRLPGVVRISMPLSRRFPKFFSRVQRFGRKEGVLGIGMHPAFDTLVLESIPEHSSRIYMQLRMSILAQKKRRS